MQRKAQKMVNLSLKVKATLARLQTAFVFDDEDNESFEPTYQKMLDELLDANQQIQDIAEDIKLASRSQ